MKQFNAQECLRALGLEEGGRVQQAVDATVLSVCEPYIPRDSGDLIQSGIIHTVIGSGEVVWSTPYAHFVHEGLVYVDPETGSTWAKKDGRKVPTDRVLQYQNGALRGHHWVDRAMQDGGLEEVRKKAQEAMKK